MAAPAKENPGSGVLTPLPYGGKGSHTSTGWLQRSRSRSRSHIRNTQGGLGPLLFWHWQLRVFFVTMQNTFLVEFIMPYNEYFQTYNLQPLNESNIPNLIIISTPKIPYNWVSPTVSIFCAGVGLIVTWVIARKAREITSQQKQIAEQTKKIAEDKLDADIFIKRCDFYLTLSYIYNTLIKKNFSSAQELSDFLSDAYSRSIPPSFLFSPEDDKIIQNCVRDLGLLCDFREKNLTIDDSEEHKKELLYFKDKIKNANLAKVKSILSKYVPDAMTSPPDFISTTAQASPDMPQPAAPIADQ